MLCVATSIIHPHCDQFKGGGGGGGVVLYSGAYPMSIDVVAIVSKLSRFDCGYSIL